MQTKLKKISITSSTKGFDHQDSAIQQLKLEVEDLRRQIKFIQTENKENQKPRMDVEQSKKMNLITVTDKNWLSMKQIKNCVDMLEKALSAESNSNHLIPYVNSLLTAFQYELERIHSLLMEKDQKLMEQEKIKNDIKEKYLQAEQKNQIISHTFQNFRQQLHEREFQLSQQASIISSYQNQFHSMSQQFMQSQAIIEQLNRQVEVRQEKQHLYKAIQFKLNEKIDQIREKYKEMEQQKQYYRSYIQDMVVKIKRMEEEVLFYKMQRSKWKVLREDS